ncbi:hypothetical protein ACIBBB_02355 [Streptomyces sp. NPDC051217]|uniref:hypothetical protein n=1 Tax=Streptomyces sp. NPDC051217 TaxID=3365644 RepID=UPI0037ADB2DD
MRHYSLPDAVGISAGAPQPPSLYEWDGGSDAFERLFGRFYEKVVDDESPSPLFAGMSENHPHPVALRISEAFGGPPNTRPTTAGYENMLAHETGRSPATGSHRLRRANCRAVTCR